VNLGDDVMHQYLVSHCIMWGV